MNMDDKVKIGKLLLGAQNALYRIERAHQQPPGHVEYMSKKDMALVSKTVAEDLEVVANIIAEATP